MIPFSESPRVAHSEFFIVMSSFIESEASETPAKARFLTKDRQWDGRFVSSSTDSDARLVELAKQGFESGKFRYILIGGPEIGENPKQDDYGMRHVHLCIVTPNPVTRAYILKHFEIKRNYYLVGRNRSLPVSGWREHHTKVSTKIDPNQLLLFEAGELPADTSRVFTLRSSEEKKRKVDEVIREIHGMLKRQETEEKIFEMYPRNWMMYGEKIKSMMVQRMDYFKQNGNPHMWIYGSAGCGKSSLVSYIYPKSYKKNLFNRYFDLYKPTEHDHVLLEDLDHAAVETLSFNFIKTLCDESGFTFDQKYKAAQPARTTLLVTSQFDIGNILAGQDKQFEIGKQGDAFRRRMWEVRATEIHRICGIKLRSKYELMMLKREDNQEPGKCFMAWNYVDDMPSLEPMPTPEECQQKIKDAFYNKK